MKNDAGLPLGTVCVLDTEPRPDGLSPVQADTLRALARAVMREIWSARGQSFPPCDRGTAQACASGRADGRLGAKLQEWFRYAFILRETRPAIGPAPVSEFAANLHPDDQDRARAWGHKGDQEEIRYIYRHDGRVVWLLVLTITLPEEGEPERMIGITFDITDRKLAQERTLEVGEP